VKTITLARQVSYTFQTYATWGIFFDGQSPFAVCLEPPRSQRIAPGTFIYQPYLRPAKDGNPAKWVFKAVDVPGHEGIEIHTGVFPRDTTGCQIIGESFEYMTYKGFTGDGQIGRAHV
jgi:hypothetical protein